MGNSWLYSRRSTLFTAKITSPLLCSLAISLPTYFVLGTQELPKSVIKKLDESDGELCENLFFLGKRAIFKTSQGIRIVTLGGSRISNPTAHEKMDKHLPFYSDGDAKILRGANSADILIT